MEEYNTSISYIADLSRRTKRYRIEYPMTQQQLADKAGLSLRSVQYFENGQDIKLESFVKILMALGLEDNIKMLLPDPDERPSAYLQRDRKHIKQRVRNGISDNKKNLVFQWGDEK